MQRSKFIFDRLLSDNLSKVVHLKHSFILLENLPVSPDRGRLITIIVVGPNCSSDTNSSISSKLYFISDPRCFMNGFHHDSPVNTRQNRGCISSNSFLTSIAALGICASRCASDGLALSGVILYRFDHTIFFAQLAESGG